MLKDCDWSGKRIYNVSNICFPTVDGNVLIRRMKDISDSNGSACSSAVVEPSLVLKAMGLSDDDAFTSLRFSWGRFNTNEEIEKASEILNKEMQYIKTAFINKRYTKKY